MRQNKTKNMGDRPMTVALADKCRDGVALGSHFFKKVRTGANGGESRSVSVALPVQDEFTGQLLKQKVPFPPPKHPKFTFIDLFAGIGGFRIAMQRCGGQCVFSSEWDAAAEFKEARPKVTFYRTRQTPTAEKAVAESKEKSKEKILAALACHPEWTMADLVREIGLSRSGIERNLRLLKADGRLRREGADKGGTWQVLKA